MRKRATPGRIVVGRVPWHEERDGLAAVDAILARAKQALPLHGLCVDAQKGAVAPLHASSPKDNPGRTEGQRIVVAQKHANKTTDEALRQRLTAARSGWDTKAPAPTADDIAYARVIAHDPCSYCGGPGGVIDHVTYNEHGWENLTASCRRCNVAKGQQSMLRFVYARRATQRHYKPRG